VSFSHYPRQPAAASLRPDASAPAAEASCAHAEASCVHTEAQAAVRKDRALMRKDRATVRKHHATVRKHHAGVRKHRAGVWEDRLITQTFSRCGAGSARRDERFTGAAEAQWRSIRNDHAAFAMEQQRVGANCIRPRRSATIMLRSQRSRCKHGFSLRADRIRPDTTRSLRCALRTTLASWAVHKPPRRDAAGADRDGKPCGGYDDTVHGCGQGTRTSAEKNATSAFIRARPRPKKGV